MLKNKKCWLEPCKKNKRIIRNIEGGGKNHNEFVKKLFSIGLSTSLMLAMVPLGKQNFVAEAVDPITISEEIFITKDDLLKLCNETNEGKGLLATGEESIDKKIRINLGTRQEDTNFIGYKDNDVIAATAFKDTPITWLVAGGSKGVSDNSENVVLFAEYPIIGGYKYNPGSQDAEGAIKSYFSENQSNKTFNATTEIDYESNNSSLSVYANHWGASDLRSSMKKIFTGGYFNAIEKSLFFASTVKTSDQKNSSTTGNQIVYKTTDYLYAPAAIGSANSFTTQVGENNDFIIAPRYWGGSHWVRTPSSVFNFAMYAWPFCQIYQDSVNRTTPGIQPACKLDISNVIFASAAFEDKDTEGFSEIVKSKHLGITEEEKANYEIDETLPAMTLRLDGTDKFAADSTLELNDEDSTLHYKIADDERLMILATTDENKTYQLDLYGPHELTMGISAMSSLIDSKKFVAKAWLEKDVEDGSQLKYAKCLKEFSYTASEEPASGEPENPSDELTNAHPDWGTPEVHGGITHYVDAEGMTSVEISPENTDKNGIVWLREESYDPDLGRNTAAWYGFDNSDGVFENGSRAYVHWYNKQQNPEKFDNIDETHEIDSDNCYYFEVGVIRPDGTQYTQLSKPVNFYVQIGDDWDKDDLQAYYITQGEDESVSVKYDATTYPEGTDDFGIMSLSHFSPYFIYDKLTDEEKAQLDAVAKELAAQQEEKTAEANEISTDESTKTGDEITYFTISGLGLIMTLALGLMINSKINRKKFDK